LFVSLATIFKLTLISVLPESPLILVIPKFTFAMNLKNARKGLYEAL